MSPKSSPGNNAPYMAENSNSEENGEVSASPAFLRQFAIPNTTVRQVLAEAAGTFILVVFGLGVLAQVTLHDGGSWLQISIGWGIALTMGVFYSGGVSGGHLNPAITLTMALFDRLPWIKVLPYIFGQLVGAFVAAVVVFCCYYSKINAYNLTHANMKDTAGIFATYPDKDLSILGAFFNEAVATGFLVAGIFAICDNMNHGASKGAKPFAIGAVIAAVAMSFGKNTGFALNPARDFAPRLFTLFNSDWGFHVFYWDSFYFWVPIVAPCVGAIAGGFLYTLFVEMHHPTVNSILQRNKPNYGAC